MLALKLAASVWRISESWTTSCRPERRAAGRGEHGPRPLLVIAGAGSGKTNTLAHRVANLVVHGADPPGSCSSPSPGEPRASPARRVERIVAAAVALESPAHLRPITWSGTFHAIGARLLRHHARDIGIDPAFSIHDREDSADLMNLVRHELGLSTKERRFPLKATCLAIYSLAVNAQLPIEVVLARQFPWCKDWQSELKGLFKGYVRQSSARTSSIT